MKRLALAWVILGGLALFFVLFAIRVAYGQDRSGLDLPVKPVKFGDKPTFLPKPDRPMEDDPRDTPPPTIYGEEILSETGTVVYVLDKSGSMGIKSKTLPGQSMNRLDKARAQIGRSLSELPSDWRFGICVYSSGVWHMAPRLVLASPVNKASAVKWLSKFVPSGSTYTGPAMVDSFQTYSECDTFVLLTDGAPSRGIDVNREQIKNGNTQGAVVDVFGIEAYGSFRAFCQGVAADSGGSYTDVD